MESNYWQSVLSSRVSRRRAVIATGATSLGAALLAACGGGSGESSGDSNSLVSKPVDTTKQAKKGGTFKDVTPTDAVSLDTLPLQTSLPKMLGYVYSRLVMQTPGVLQAGTGATEGDIAESWEFSGDKLTLTMKLRANAKWDARAPTNSRTVDANDVAFSWDRYARLGAKRADLANSVGPAGSVASVTAADARTLVIKLAYPDPDIFNKLSDAGTGGFLLIPKEMDGGFDPKQDMRGSGSFFLSEYVPSSRAVFKKNPNYWNAELPLVDTWEYPIIGEYSTILAQFKTGAIYRFPTGSTISLKSEDVLPTKRDVPALSMFQTRVDSDNLLVMYGFADGAKSQFRDERVRQAFSMSWDRELWIDTFRNVSQLKAEGLPVDTAWNSSLVNYDAGWWLDPRSKEFGENGKFYQHNIAEAKKLLSAAGYAGGVDIDSHYITTGEYGADYVRKIEVLTGMADEAGIHLKPVTYNYLTEWPKVRDAKGNFTGVAWYRVTQAADAGAIPAMFTAAGSQFKGWSADGKSTFAGDPYLEDLAGRIQKEFDRPKRFELAHELQRYVGKAQYMTRFPGGANNYELAWPAIGNMNVYHLGFNDSGFPLDNYLWIDQTKAPFVKA